MKEELDSIKAYHLAQEILDSHQWIKKITIKTMSGSASVWRDDWGVSSNAIKEDK